MKKITIAIEGSSLINPKSGTGRYTLELIKFLVRNKDLSVTAILPRVGNQASLSNIQNLEIMVDQSCLWTHVPILLWIRYRLSKLIHSKSFDYLICPITLVPSYINERTKIVSIIHDLNYLIVPETMSYGTRIMHKIFFRKSIVQSSIVIANSNQTKISLVKLLGISADLIINPPLTTTNNASLQDVNSIYPELHNNKYILFVGTIEPRKNLSTFIHAFLNITETGLYPDFKIAIVGTYGWHAKKVMRLIKIYSDQVVHLDNVSDQELNILYGNAFAVTLPSIHEGYGMPAAEANSFGSRLLATDIPEIREAAQNNGTFVEPTLIGLYAGLVAIQAADKTNPIIDNRFQQATRELIAKMESLV